jgi:hypothetical protein|tara:strand:+ start:87 stop:299 length:213 start_codon:yes stop_codon:yes gene_type:complete
MCIICVDLEKGKLSPWEASRNRTEMLSQFDEEHLKVLDEKIRKHLLLYLNNLNEKNKNNDNSSVNLLTFN